MINLLKLLRESILEFGDREKTPYNTHKNELYSPGDTDEPPYSRFDTAKEEGIEEGVNDPNIFKAIFLAGGPGSGKSYVASKLAFTAKGLRPVNNDDAFEYMMKKHKLDPKMPDSELSKREPVRKRAGEVTETKMANYINGRLGMVIDGTAKDAVETYKTKAALEELGYQTMMVFVDTSLETALKRNQERPRSVPEEVLSRIHAQVRQNKLKLQQIFGRDYTEVENDQPPIDYSDAEKHVNEFLRRPITPKAKQWVEDQKQQTKK